MNSEFDEILAGLAPKPPRSRLEPYGELIAELRNRGRTFREIAVILSEKCHVSVAATTIMRFVATTHSRKEKGESSPSRVPTLMTKSCDKANAAPVINPTADEVRRRIDELKHRPVRAEAPQKLFHYDPDKPLTLMPKTDKK